MGALAMPFPWHRNSSARDEYVFAVARTLAVTWVLAHKGVFIRASVVVHTGMPIAKGCLSLLGWLCPGAGPWLCVFPVFCDNLRAALESKWCLSS